MKQVKFGITFKVNDYALGELEMFAECADSLEGVDDLQGRYIDFIKAVSAKKVKPSTLVDPDVLHVFADDLYNRALIDYIEGHYVNDTTTVLGGKMFLGRYRKLVEVHGEHIKSSADNS